MPFASRENRRR